MRNRQPTSPATPLLQPIRNDTHRPLLTGNHHRLRTIDRRDLHTLATATRTTSSSPAPTATIAPPAGNACINRPRAATNRAASANDNTPAT